MLPAAEPAPAQHQDTPQGESPAGSQISLPTEQTQSAQDIPIWRTWLVVLGAFLALFCTFGQLSSFGTYLSWYKYNQLSSYSPSAISCIGSLQLWVFFFSVRVSTVHDSKKILTYQGRVVSWDGTLTVMDRGRYSSPVLRFSYRA